MPPGFWNLRSNTANSIKSGVQAGQQKGWGVLQSRAARAFKAGAQAGQQRIGGYKPSTANSVRSIGSSGAIRSGSGLNIWGQSAKLPGRMYGPASSRSKSLYTPADANLKYLPQLLKGVGRSIYLSQKHERGLLTGYKNAGGGLVGFFAGAKPGTKDHMLAREDRFSEQEQNYDASSWSRADKAFLSVYFSDGGQVTDPAVQEEMFRNALIQELSFPPYSRSLYSHFDVEKLNQLSTRALALLVDNALDNTPRKPQLNHQVGVFLGNEEDVRVRVEALTQYATELSASALSGEIDDLEALAILADYASTFPGITAKELSDDISYILVGARGADTLWIGGGLALINSGTPLSRNLPPGVEDSFGDKGFHRDYQDGQNQPFHFWAYVNTYAQGGDTIGGWNGLIVNFLHERVGFPDVIDNPPGTSIEDERLAYAGMALGYMVNHGLIEPNQIGNWLRNVLSSPTWFSDVSDEEDWLSTAIINAKDILGKIMRGENIDWSSGGGGSGGGNREFGS